MMHSNVADNVLRTKISSVSNFGNFFRVTIAMIAISHPSQGSALPSSIPQPSPQAVASQVSQEQNTQKFAEAANSLETGDMPRMSEVGSKPDFAMSDNAEKPTALKNTGPVAIADVVELKRSSNAFNVLANDSDPDGDRLILTDALAQHGAVAFTPEGLIGYAQNPGAPRADKITYTISDNKGNFAQGTVQITIQ